MSSASSKPTTTVRDDVIDVLHKAIWAIDTNDLDLFKSAWSKSPDIVMEIGGYRMTGADNVMGLFGGVGPLDTQHLVSTVRVHFNKDITSAEITANALNQHYPPGQGLSGTDSWSLVGSRYKMEVVMESDEWKLKSWIINLVWRHGQKDLPSAEA